LLLGAHLEDPKYRRHSRLKNQAFVQISRRRIYLGRYGSAESHREYQRLIAEMHAAPTLPPLGTEVSITELISAFDDWAETRYVKNGDQTSEVHNFRAALRPLFRLYGDLLATSSRRGS